MRYRRATFCRVCRLSCCARPRSLAARRQAGGGRRRAGHDRDLGWLRAGAAFAGGIRDRGPAGRGGRLRPGHGGRRWCQPSGAGPRRGCGRAARFADGRAGRRRACRPVGQFRVGLDGLAAGDAVRGPGSQVPDGGDAQDGRRRPDLVRGSRARGAARGHRPGPPASGRGGRDRVHRRRPGLGVRPRPVAHPRRRRQLAEDERPRACAGSRRGRRPGARGRRPVRGRRLGMQLPGLLGGGRIG